MQGGCGGLTASPSVSYGAGRPAGSCSKAEWPRHNDPKAATTHKGVQAPWRQAGLRCYWQKGSGRPQRCSRAGGENNWGATKSQLGVDRDVRFGTRGCRAPQGWLPLDSRAAGQEGGPAGAAAIPEGKALLMLSGRGRKAPGWALRMLSVLASSESETGSDGGSRSEASVEAGVGGPEKTGALEIVASCRCPYRLPNFS